MCLTSFLGSDGWTEHWSDAHSCGYFWHAASGQSHWSMDVETPRVNETATPTIRPGDAKPPHDAPLHVSLGPEEEYAAFVEAVAEPGSSSVSQAAEPPPPSSASAEPGPSSASQAAEPPSPGPGSAEPVPSSASQPVEADADREDDLLSELPGEEPDWSNGDHVNEDAFDGTRDFHNGLEQRVDTETAGAMLEGIEQQRLPEAVLPEFLRPVQGSEGGCARLSRELSEMQALKEAAQEHVRWRSTCVNEADVDMAAFVSSMRAMAKSWMRDEEVLFPVRDLGLLSGTGAPGSASSAQA